MGLLLSFDQFFKMRGEPAKKVKHFCEVARQAGSRGVSPNPPPLPPDVKKVTDAHSWASYIWPLGLKKKKGLHKPKEERI